MTSRATVAMGVGGNDFLSWRRHLETALRSPVQVFDHQVAWSMYFTDPDLNPFEISCYEHEWLAAHLS